MTVPTACSNARNFPRFVALAALASMVMISAGCASREKSSSRIYEGDSPHIKFHGRESAGGPVGGR